MPRCARVKSFDSVYHIMVRSISDTPLYRCNDDKNKYLQLIKKYQAIFLFKVYAYCIMDTHAHVIIDVQGADISRIMHGINQSYAQYYNKKYNRRGHLFQDRFRSKIVSDDRYLISLSAYIHCNPMDIRQYKKSIERYKYSSLGIYLGIMEDNLFLIDKDFILSQFSKDMLEAKKLYLSFIHRCSENNTCDDIEFRHEKTEYRSERRVLIRNYTAEEIVRFVESYTNHHNIDISIKYTKKNIEPKALSALLLRGICDMKQKDICKFIGNITQSHAAKLCSIGVDLIQEKMEYKNIARDFIHAKAC